ncbi:MAG: polymer-forming cytoskeletal protein [Rhodothermales bacterium]|nr:polymer-forming cytoskeletal protein [Rhodothermales bacterium]
MGKVAVIALVAFSISGAYYTMDRNQRTLDTEAEISDHRYEVLAREAALTGLAIAKQGLADSFVPSAFTGEATNGDYDVDITVAADMATVNSVGSIMATKDVPLEYKVQASYKVIVGALPPAPNFLKYALVSDESLELGGAVVTEVFVQGEEGAELNANMHTNKNLHVNGNKAFVEGFGTYRNSASSNPASALENTFDPNYWGAGTESVYSVDEDVVIPSFDGPTWMANVASSGYTVTDIAGDFTLTGSQTYGTQENPAVIHVTGNLYSSGGAVVDGYVMFIVDGNIDISGNLEVGNSGYSGPDESSVAMYAGANLEINGNIDVAAQFYAGGDVFLGGSPNVYGGITTKGTATLQGSPSIYYRTPSGSLTTNFSGTENRLELVAYSEW